jgi:Fe-S cluster assembly scaffold protein SufB
VLHKKGVQEIKMDVKLEKNSSATFIAHCIFPNAEKVRHIMDADIDIGEGAEMRYSETHYHGLYGGIEVVPKLRVKVGDATSPTLPYHGQVEARDRLRCRAERTPSWRLMARVFGHANDEIVVRRRFYCRERMHGALSRPGWPLKMRPGEIRDHRRKCRRSARTCGLPGNREGPCRGKAIPLVQVTHPLAKVTHEAAIGSVDKRQMETLMAHGLSPEEAVDAIVKGILR